MILRYTRIPGDWAPGAIPLVAGRMISAGGPEPLALRLVRVSAHRVLSHYGIRGVVGSLFLSRSC